MRGRLLLLAALLASPAAAGTLKGVAIDDVTGHPVSDAQVALIIDPVRSVHTDSLGAFAFRGVAPGTWTVQIAGIFYEVWSTEVRIGERDTVNVQARLTPMPIPGALAGIVTTAGGKRGVRHAHVAIEDLALEGVSDDDGTFWLDGVPAGSHRVRITALGCDPVSLSAMVEPSRGSYVAVDLPASGRKAPRETFLPAADTAAVIRFAVPDTALTAGLGSKRPVRLEILRQDRPVRVLVKGVLAAEAYAIYWDGRDDRGQKLAPGPYRYRLLIAERPAAEGDLVLR